MTDQKPSNQDCPGPMQATKTHRFLLVSSGLIAIAIGSALLIVPARFHASNGIDLGTDASLLSEVRAPGGALLALGFLMLLGAPLRRFTFASTSIAAAVYLAYGASRLLGIALDGLPGTGLLAAMAIELAIGTACLITLFRAARRQDPAWQLPGHASEIGR